MVGTACGVFLSSSCIAAGQSLCGLSPAMRCATPHSLSVHTLFSDLVFLTGLLCVNLSRHPIFPILGVLGFRV